MQGRWTRLGGTSAAGRTAEDGTAGESRQDRARESKRRDARGAATEPGTCATRAVWQASGAAKGQKERGQKRRAS
ncbi:hypothetical protein BC831DRAFT_480529 [Entophlyctis helioformis]|nr:hypothetical protein BC831DRAFT_480529 [Entophlyctis helioformis]